MKHKSFESTDGAPSFSAVAVAVKGSVDEATGGAGSRRAVRWAVDNLFPKANRFVLVHVMPSVTSIPSPTGKGTPVVGLDKSIVEIYKGDMREEYERIFWPFKRMCRSSQVETLLIENNDPAKALLEYVTDSGVDCLVMGSSSPNLLARKKEQDIPLTVLENAPKPCEVCVVCKDRILNKSINQLSSAEKISISHTSKAQEIYTEALMEKNRPSTSSRASSGRSLLGLSATSQHSSQDSTTMSSTDVSVDKEFKPETPVTPPRSDVSPEVERLRKELESTLAMYKQACKELVHKQTQVQLLSSKCNEEARKATAALEEEESLKKAAAGEQKRHLKLVKVVEEAKAIGQGICEGQIPELHATRQGIEKKQEIDQLFINNRRYRKYTKDEIAEATDNFCLSKVIGEGGYGKVYKCSLNHTPVAIKVLKTDSVDKKEEFWREVAVLSQLHHPRVVLLLGACPEIGCLVYEYMDNGSLEDFICYRNKKPTLPWFIRFRIIFEVACGLAFLHNFKPEPIVHRDLKPGNILLDRNYVSKIGDVGLAKLVADAEPESITVYRESIIAGTFFYMDPEYLRTGTIRPKSDLYAFGIIILQLLTARRPNGLLFCVEDAVERGRFCDVLDGTVKDWPLAEVEELACIALKCSQAKCRDRPDLDLEVLPALKRILESANSKIKTERNNLHPSSHYYCPILKEIMEDPHIAADGYTYEHKAIKSWIEKYKVSPVTKQRLQHLDLTPNHMLRAAIQEWQSYVELSSTLDM